MKYRYIYFILSALVILPGIYSLIRYGLKPSIDFTGGSLLELEFKNKVGDQSAVINNVLNDNKFESYNISFNDDYRVLIRSKPIDKEQVASISAILGQKLNDSPKELRFETVGPILGKELIRKTILSIILAASFILLYVWRQFRNPMFGVCAILAMFHDSLVLLGIFSLLGHFKGVEIDTLFVTAVLTVLSFSVHDTVVVYDRIRESMKKYPNISFVEMANKAVTETLSRSINNSMTIIFMLIALYLLGGETTRWFVLALLVGTISGTYSSTFTAAPLLVVWNNIQNRKKN